MNNNNNFRPSMRSLAIKKKSPNGYIIFCIKYYPLLREEFPHYTQRQIRRVMGERWRKLPVDLKNGFLVFASVENRIRNFNPAMMGFNTFYHNEHNEHERPDDEYHNEYEHSGDEYYNEHERSDDEYHNEHERSGDEYYNEHECSDDEYKRLFDECIRIP
ncbi:hypothetical protein GLOIN_2v1482544 [Rhizophagus clarus]|uniref:HMG box domain-containing protein n=2 Tax=Rhizophagus clarus TaxID=94130 RepID=A0A8H3KNJ8_9GLOM|nr:hypothetical protein GLOIN_2v1482544 [Rhizophagus clarus]